MISLESGIALCLVHYLPQKLRDINCLLSWMVLLVLSLQVPAWGSAGGMLTSQEIKEHKHKGMQPLTTGMPNTLPHPAIPCYTFPKTFHQLKGTAGSTQEAQKNEILLPNLFPTSVMTPITNGKCRWSRGILGVTKLILMLATFRSLGPLCRLTASKHTGSKNTRRTSVDT